MFFFKKRCDMTKLMEELIKLNEKLDFAMAEIREAQRRLAENNDSTLSMLKRDLSGHLTPPPAAPKNRGRPKKKT